MTEDEKRAGAEQVASLRGEIERLRERIDAMEAALRGARNRLRFYISVIPGMDAEFTISRYYKTGEGAITKAVLDRLDAALAGTPDGAGKGVSYERQTATVD